MFKLSDFGVTRNVAFLSNGARVVTFERPGMPLYMEALFFAGSRFDPPDKDGTAHFMEHVIAHGTKKFPTVDKMAAFIERLGGQKNAFTGNDPLGVEAWLGDPSDIASAIEVVTEIIQNPLFDPEVVELERKTIFREIGMDDAEPAEYLGILWNELLFQDSPEGRSVAGTVETVGKVTLEDLKNHYRSYITPEKMTFIVSGGVQVERVKEELEKQFLLKGSPNISLTEKSFSKRDRFIATRKYTGSDHIYFHFGFLSCSHFHQDNLPLRLLGSIIASGFNSVLYKKLRIEKGLVYSVGATNVGFADRGYWLVDSSTSKDKLQEVLNIIVEEIGKLYNGEISQEQLDFIKDKSVKSIRLGTQTVESWVGIHRYHELFRPQDNFTLDQLLNRIESITLDEIKTVAKKYLAPGNWYFAATGDVEDSDIKINY